MTCLYERCKTEFEPRRKDQVYCCRDCQKKASYKRTGGEQRSWWRKQGITLEPAQYKELVLEQNSKCLICKNLTDKLRVDHNHVSGKIRGLLCNNCNAGLGLFGDNVELLQSAIKYLQITESNS